MTVKNIKHLIIFLIFISFSLSNYNLFGVTLKARALQAQQKAKKAIQSKNAENFNVAMSDFDNITQVPGGAVAVNKKRNNVVLKALNAITAPEDVQFLIDILEQIIDFAPERIFYRALLRGWDIEEKLLPQRAYEYQQFNSF